MSDVFAQIIPYILQEEGGYVDHPSDPGGSTNHGITLKTLESWRKRPVTKQDVKNLTEKEAIEIYEQRYWRYFKDTGFSAGLSYALLDAAINHGPTRAVKLLQEGVGTATDGIIGNVTRAAVAKLSSEEVLQRLMIARMKFYLSLSEFPVFGKGWLSRVIRVLSHASTLDTPAKSACESKTYTLSQIFAKLSELEQG